MAIRVALHHQTEYRYDRPVTIEPHVVRLRPAPHCRTPIRAYSLKVEPGEHFLNWQQDPYSNYLARLVFPKPARSLLFTVDLVAEMISINPFDFFIEAYAEKYPFQYDGILARELIPYLETQPPGPELASLIRETKQSGGQVIDYLVSLNQKLNKLIGYVIRLEPGIQSCEETLTKRTGSCRDSAWLLVQLLRHQGLAARFVSGYLIQLTADVKSLDGPSGPESDFTDLHAWAEVYLPGAGWIGLDPTSGLLAGEGHIPLACAADPITAAPITGSYSWSKSTDNDYCREEFRHSMKVTRIHEDPRVTRPYTERQWRQIDDLGREIDEMLRARDVRLTMGGEPTFVSIDDRDGEEWNTAALGPHKRERAGVLLRRLRDRFAPQGLLHFGQGKWYPGESLPRWALGCYWRLDGQPMWQDPALVAEDGKNYDASPQSARWFVTTLARKLGVDPSLAIPGHEDAWYYLWRERRLPTNVDPLQSKLDDAEERARLTKIFNQGLDKIVGFALPVQRVHTPEGSYWVSGKWFLRREHMFLIPGDSPMGYRLPLDSLPWVAPGDREPVIEHDPFEHLDPLPPHSSYLASGGRQPAESAGAALAPRFQSRESLAPSADFSGGLRPPLADWRPPLAERAPIGHSQPGVVRTALCIEPRGGTLFVFMPPIGCLEDYLDLVAAIEATAAELALPVQLEGYSPPSDHRLQHLKITPDPGVIEVNIHPSHDWEQLRENTHIIYEEAHHSRLSTEKFMLDGRHTGTGGGNHVVLGGPSPGESPLLRRPDLLRSLVGYWHNHPSLSYLFSGMFVGPTSQAPRVDEARNDNLYELEIAFRQIPERCAAGDSRPWIVDRVFRHLLVDLTGNTHRAEFCIDKLYSPDSLDGRRGLLEFRAFEMPPHWQMSLVQQVLLRALVARFWDQPYQAPLVRWGTELHDRFMLPHFVLQDFQDVLFELRQAGLPLQEAWFAPHFEFRFPQHGHFTQRGVHVELRQAVEPWHVLGEEATGNGTARFVDSSLERLQIKVSGLTDARHIVTCNGRRVPLHPTGVNGEFVAGVRYRAWQPPSCLHPTIPVHAPLVIDLLDSWMGRSLGGCTYHVAHPGGRAHDTFPVNANEAEGRRVARFFSFGHSPGPIAIPPEVRHAENPLTLDLRQASAETEFPLRAVRSVDSAPTAAADSNGSHHRGNGASKLYSPQNVEREHMFS
ncbi:MAG TPA: transglutaminase family protein [Pirellulaceae bacterium]|nr:transglutaminase family protein [Pirellulaceae bacterium]